MSAATAQPCVVCHASSSKYKCPTCRNATCSLTCSKQHAAQGHLASDSNQASSSSSVHSVAQDRLLPSLHLRNEILEAPQAHRFSKIDKYVGLNEYDSKQLMEDFEYLQYLGKCVTLLGKDITKNGYLKEEPQPKPNGNHQHQGQGQGGSVRGGYNKGANNTSHQHVSAEIKNRHTFESWIRKLKLPIMLVPDGMSLRKENQTRWKNNTKQLLCTVEVRFPTASSSAKSRSLLHHIPWDKQISEVVLKEMGRRARQKYKASGDDEVVKMCEGVTMDNWSDSFCIAISVSNDRLRNESSSKFLEWWQRQVKNGMVKADGLEFDEEKKGALEQLRSGAWAAIEGIDSAEAWPAAKESAEQSTLEAESEGPSSGGLISSMLLERMQAARAMRAQLGAATATSAEDARSGQPTIGTRRSLLILDGGETFQQLLQSLTKGLAIVEYFHTEVWTKRALLKQIKSGIILRERLEGRGEESDGNLERTLGKRGHDDVLAVSAVEAKKAKTEANISKSNALGNLNAYASSDEEDEEKKEEQGEKDLEDMSESKPMAAGGLAEMARLLGMVRS